MPLPSFKADDFARAMRALLPRGRAWISNDDGARFKLLSAFGLTYERQSARAANLLVDAFPGTTVELLPEWEASTGLPDPCAGAQPTIDARRAQVVARLSNSGGQSRAYFINYAKRLGYDIGVVNYAPFRAGHSRAGEPVASEDWWYTWAVTAPLYSINYFRAGIGAAGEPLAYWNNDVLECELNAIKPAHSILIFLYS